MVRSKNCKYWLSSNSIILVPSATKICPLAQKLVCFFNTELVIINTYFFFMAFNNLHLTYITDEQQICSVACRCIWKWIANTAYKIQNQNKLCTYLEWSSIFNHHSNFMQWADFCNIIHTHTNKISKAIINFWCTINITDFSFRAYKFWNFKKELQKMALIYCVLWFLHSPSATLINT